MNRKILLFGILLLIAGLAVGWATASSSLSNLSNQSAVNSTDLSVNHNTVLFKSVQITTPSIFSLSYISTNVINFYFVNSTTFAALQPYFNSNNSLEGRALQYKGNGLLEMVLNNESGLAPYQSSYASIFPKPTYYSNFSLLANGTYYSIFENRNNFTETIAYKSLLVPLSKFSSSNNLFGVSEISALISGVLFVLGLLLVAYAFLTDRGNIDKKQKERSIQEAYAKLGKKEHRGKKSRKKRRQK